MSSLTEITSDFVMAVSIKASKVLQKCMLCQFGLFYIYSIVLERTKLSELLKVARSRKSCPKVAEHLRDSVPQTVFNLIPPLIHFQESSMITTVLESSGVAKASTMTLEFSFVTLHTSVRH